MSRRSVCGLGRDFPATASVFVAGRRVTARRTGTLAVCWVLFVSVAVATVRLGWQRRGGGGGGCYVIHGQWGRPSGATVWQRSPKEPERKHLVDLQRLSCCAPLPTMHQRRQGWCLKIFIIFCAASTKLHIAEDWKVHSWPLEIVGKTISPQAPCLLLLWSFQSNHTVFLGRWSLPSCHGVVDV